MNQIQNTKFLYKEVGDDIGFVQYVEHMGTDLTIVNAARVSFGKRKEKYDDKDRRLVKFLAMINSKNFEYSFFARDKSTVLLKPTTPPYALFLSVLKALLKDKFIDLADPTPHGLLCLIMTHVGSVNSSKQSNPESISRILL